MDFLRVVWDYETGGNVEHIDEHDLTPEDVEFVLAQSTDEQISQSTGRPCVFGYTESGEYIIVVFEWVDEDTVLPITAYEVAENPKSRNLFIDKEENRTSHTSIDDGRENPPQEGS